MLSTDALLYALITVVAMEFDILKLDFLDLQLEAERNRTEKLKSLVLRHCKLFEVADKLEKIFELIFLFGFVLSSLVMCYIAFILSITNDVASFVYFVPLFATVCGQMLLLCVYGQKIMESSFDVADGIFCCNLEDQNDVALTKQFVLIMVRAQKSKRLSAMGFFNVTLENFTSVSDKHSTK